MNTELVESQSTFGLYLEGENEIDANLLSDTIKNIAELTKLAAKEENPEAYLKMNVKAFRNGSFEIDFSAIALVGLTFLSDPLTFAESVVAVVKGFLENNKLLKGKPPKSVEATEDGQIKVEAAGGETIVAPKASEAVINNVNIDTLVVNVTKNARTHNPKGGFSLKTQNGVFSCTANEIDAMITPVTNKEIVNCKRIREKTKLHIKKPDLVGISKWDFKYKNRIINAGIEDVEWLNSVHNGQIAIRAGDYIIATIEVDIEIDENGQFVTDSEKYRVLEVHGDLIHDDTEQIKLP